MVIRRGALFVVGRRLIGAVAPRGGRGRQQKVQQAFLGILLGFFRNFFDLLLADHFDGDFHKVPNHGFDVAADVAHLSKPRGLHFEEGRVGQPRETTRDLRLTDPRGTDHDDVLRQDLFRQFFGKFLPADAVAQGDGDRTLGLRLTDHVLIQFGHDLTRSQGIQGRGGLNGFGKVEDHGKSVVAGGRLELGTGNRGSAPIRPLHCYSSSTMISLLVKMQISPARRIASSTISRAFSDVCLASARAADRA